MSGSQRAWREYAPAEDTFLLADAAGRESGRAALDVGTGSGYLAGVLQERFETVVATDVDLGVLRNQTYPARMRVCCHGASALRGPFDLAVCNPPYLATEQVLDPATDGGPGGFEVPASMIRTAAPLLRPGGKLLFVSSSLSDYGRLVRLCSKLGMPASVARRKRLFFEELVVVEAVASGAGGPRRPPGRPRPSAP